MTLLFIVFPGMLWVLNSKFMFSSIEPSPRLIECGVARSCNRAVCTASQYIPGGHAVFQFLTPYFDRKGYPKCRCSRVVSPQFVFGKSFRKDARTSEKPFFLNLHVEILFASYTIYMPNFKKSKFLIKTDCWIDFS